MKLLFTGGGKSGAYLMRAQQLGDAVGADVKPKAVQGEYDLVVAVKRGFEPRHFRRWVWDLVDFYPQPAAYHWEPKSACQWVRDQIGLMKPCAIIWPTKVMREDCDTGLPGIVLPHHCRSGLKGKPESGLVGYEGAAQYLGKWRSLLEAECQKRGMRFVVNPTDYSRLETVVAFRENGGYVSRYWKSGVKHSNAVAIGAKFIAQMEAGYFEQAVGGEQWVESPEQLSAAFDNAVPLKGSPFTVEQAAAALKPFLHAL